MNIMLAIYEYLIGITFLLIKSETVISVRQNHIKTQKTKVVLLRKMAVRNSDTF